MDEFCEGANRAAMVMAVFLTLVGAFHVLAVSAALVLWLFDRRSKRGD